jgi:hypothetical protein
MNRAAHAWPDNAHHCHALLDALAAQNTALSETLTLAQQCVAELEAQSHGAVEEECEAEITAFVQQHRKLTHGAVADMLMEAHALPRELARLKAALPTLSAHLRKLSESGYDRRKEKRPSKVWARHRDLRLHRLLVDFLRDRDKRCLFVLSVARSLAIQTQHAGAQLRSNLGHEGIVHDEAVLNSIRRYLSTHHPHPHPHRST